MKRTKLFTPGKIVLTVLLLVLAVGLVAGITSGGSTSGGGGGGSSSAPVCKVHSFADPVVVSEVSCITPGIIKQICTACGYEQEEYEASYHDSRCFFTYDGHNGSSHDVVCDICSYCFSEICESDCWYPLGASMHYSNCRLCGQDLYNNHSFNKNGTCVKCEVFIYCECNMEWLEELICYPSDTEPGQLKHYCINCGMSYIEEFTSLSRTITFGGEAFRDYLVNGTKNGYAVKPNDKVITLAQSATPEWDIFYDIPLLFGNDSKLQDCVYVDYYYDEEIWGKDDLGFSRQKNISYDEPYRFRIAAGNTIAIMFESNTIEIWSSEWTDPDTCPLVLAPITVTMTFNWRHQQS